jgi:metallo-beta-lactamase family protein
MVKLTASLEFLGAAGGVTGSKTLLRFAGANILVDCGLFQGPKAIREKNRDPVLVAGRQIDAIVLTHAHLDHSGYIPRIVREGFQGPIYCSKGTGDLIEVLLTDAAHLEQEFASYANKTGYSSHKPADPLFTQADVERALKLVKTVDRGQWFNLNAQLSIRFLHAGHIIGASMAQFSLAFENATRLITFSGDLGHSRSLTIRPPEQIIDTDALILESTYGDRDHPRTDVVKEFATIAKRTFERGGTLVIPAFAVGRAQEILHIIRLAENEDLIPKFPVVLDSPMARKATQIYFSHPEDHSHLICENRVQNCDEFLPHHFSMTESSDDSMLACMKDGPQTVISAAGMLNGGRILHHLKARLPKEENTVLFCGYQAEGTKGRFLQDGGANLEYLRIHHEEVPVNAEIATISSLSAHADRSDLIAWVKQLTKQPRKIFLNHGDPAAMSKLQSDLIAAGLTCPISTLTSPAVFELFS